MIRCLLPILAMTLSSTAWADEYTCRSGNEVRLVSVEYEHKGWDVPCRVKYEKPAQDTVEYPWSAETTLNYCEEKAAFLVSKLENWGWVCDRDD